MKRLISFTIVFCLLFLNSGAAGAIIFTPIIDPAVTNPGSDLYVPRFTNSESDVLAATMQAWNQDIEKLKALDKKYPGKGFQKFADELEAKRKSYFQAAIAKGWSVWGSTPSYVSVDNSLCLTDQFFTSSYLPEERVAIVIHELQHIEQYRLYRVGSNMLNLYSFGLIAKPAESSAYVEEYKWLRLLGQNQSFEMQNVLLALVEQGVITSVNATDLLDQQLGIQIAAKITSTGLDAALGKDDSGSLGNPGNIALMTVIPNRSVELVGAVSEYALKSKPAAVPSEVQGKTGFAIPGPGTMTLKVGFASYKDYGPRFVGDELGYRRQAYLIFKHSGGEVQQSFSNGYNKDWAYVTITRHFDGPDSCTLTVIPQGAAAGISPVSGQLVEMSDGSGYIYYGGAYRVELHFQPDAQIAKSPELAPEAIKVSINGEPLVTDAPPVIRGGRTLVPLRAIFEALQAQVYWEAATQTAIGIKDGLLIKLVIDQSTALVGDQAVELDVPATIINGRTMVPARFIAESLGKNVIWDAAAHTVRISD